MPGMQGMHGMQGMYDGVVVDVYPYGTGYAVGPPAVAMNVSEAAMARYNEAVSSIRRTHAFLFVFCSAFMIGGILLAVFGRGDTVRFVGWALTIFGTMCAVMSSAHVRSRLRAAQYALAAGQFEIA
jgi:hypothetical protein